MNRREGELGVLNFRDLGVSTVNNATGKSYIKEGMVFRSATMDNMTQQDVDAFINKHHIRTILDLRSSVEWQDGKPIDQCFPTVASLYVLNSAKTKESSLGLTDQMTTLRRKYRIDFVGKNFQRNCIFMSCSLRLKLTIILLMLLCQRRRAAIMVGQEVLSPKGLDHMYQSFLMYCQSEIRAALLVFTEPSNYPVHIHCTQGKDRTGLVSSLILSISGVPRDIIIKDYAKTQAGLALIYDDMLSDIRRAGLSDEFANASPQNMEGLLEYIDTKYGSVETYLNIIGFGPDLQEQIRNIIST